MLRFDTGNEVIVSNDSTFLAIRGGDESDLFETLIAAVSSGESPFRQLGQVIAANDYEAPSLVCIRTEGDTTHLFLFGSGTIQIIGDDTPISTQGSTTWMERNVPASAELQLVWEEPPADSSDPAAKPARIGSGSHAPSPPALEPMETESQSGLTSSPEIETPGPVAPQPRMPAPPTPPPPSAPKPVMAPSTQQRGLQPSNSRNVGGEPAPRMDTAETEADATLDVEAVRARILSPPAKQPAPLQSKEHRTGPTVDAQICPCGAANRVGAPLCHACGSSMSNDGVEIGRAPRPPLGTLTFDDGQQHVLVGSVVIGRNPPDDHIVTGELFEPIQVDSPKRIVSKAHLEIRLMGWTVNVVDLDSSNGTRVETSSGTAPKRLRPNVVEQISSDTTIRFGDRSVVFQATEGM